MLLQVTDLHAGYGKAEVLRGLSIQAPAGSVITVIGPNGAGKSTVFNLLTGVLPPNGGEVHFRGERIDTLSARAIVPRGMARTFQQVHLLPAMSVLENVAIGAHLRGTKGVISAALRLERAEEAMLLAEALRQLERVGLGGSVYEQAGSLPLGQQRILEIARALSADPVLLLLDEPAAGLRYQEKRALAELLRKLKSEGMSILLVEHDMDFVMKLVDRLVVMDFGEKLAEGQPQEIQTNALVLEAYLGGVE